MSCQDCEDREPHAELNIVAADLGEGAFLAVLCDVCWHRRKYRADLVRRRADLAESGRQIGAQATIERPGAAGMARAGQSRGQPSLSDDLADELAWGYVPK